MTSTQRDEADTGEDKAVQPPHSDDNIAAAQDGVSGADAGDVAGDRMTLIRQPSRQILWKRCFRSATV